MTEIPQATPEEQAAARRIIRWEHDPAYPVIAGHTYPRWLVKLRAPEAAAPLFKRARADRRALMRLIEQEHAARVEAIGHRWAGGDLTPNRRAVEMAEAEQERQGRAARVEAAYADLTEDAALARAKDAARREIEATWAEAMAAHGLHDDDTDGPRAA